MLIEGRYKGSGSSWGGWRTFDVQDDHPVAILLKNSPRAIIEKREKNGRRQWRIPTK